MEDRSQRLCPQVWATFWTAHLHRNPQGKLLENLMRVLGRSPKLSAFRPFWANWRHHCPSRDAYAIVIQSKQLSPFSCTIGTAPYPDEILSGFEEDVSFTRDGFTTWVEDFNTFGTACGRQSPSRSIAKHLSEDTTHLLKSITSTTTCPTVHPYENC